MKGVWALVLVILTCGCAVQRGVRMEFHPNEGRRAPSVALRQGHLWIRSFDHRVPADVSSVYIDGQGQHSSGLAFGESQISAPPDFLVAMFEESGIFESVMIGDVDSPDFIVEGSLEFHRKQPWWSHLQWIDLRIHAWVLPTLGQTHISIAEIRLYDSEHYLLRSWTARYEKSYMCDVWWSALHGGSLDMGPDVNEQKEVCQFMMDEIREDLARSVVGCLERGR